MARVMEHNGKQYFYSVIHAGEQNYKYFENEYFPYLYGLYHLEYIAAKKHLEKQLEQWKEKFISQFTQLWRSAGKFVLEDDLKRMKKMQITRDWGTAVVNTSWRYLADENLKSAVDIAKKITLGGE